MRTVKGGEETLQRFVYDNYLCIQQLRGADNALFHSYIWNPTELIATRPLSSSPPPLLLLLITSTMAIKTSPTS